VPKRKIHFIGFLANTDSSIVHVKLQHRFKFQSMSYQDASNLISEIEGPYARFGFTSSSTLSQCLDSTALSCPCVTNSFSCDVRAGNEWKITEFPHHADEFDKNSVGRYLIPKIRLMRLFKEGAICMPLRYYYAYKQSKRTLISSSLKSIVTGTRWSVNRKEVPDLGAFIKSTNLPFAKSFLELAFENFELSYEVPNLNLVFLSLMISMETMFNPGHQEVRYRISRNAAVLLGETFKEAKRIFVDIRDLYDKRSELVHTGSKKVIRHEDLLKLRNYVRESIKEINMINRDKDDLLDTLNSCGFGQRPWRDRS